MICKEAENICNEILKTVGTDGSYAELVNLLEVGAPFGEIREKCVTYAEKASVNKYSLMMTLLISNLDIAKKRWLEKGFDEALFQATAEDFNYKINECKKVYGVWGIEPFEWYEHLYFSRLVKLGRLEYEIRENSPVCVHIPSAGPLNHDEVTASYKKAYDFFPKTYGNVIVFTCNSYLLFPPYSEKVFSPDSNIFKFARDFCVYKTTVTDSFSDSWRVFDKPFLGDVASLPQNTSLQKSFTAYIENDGTFGIGSGVVAFDGEKVVKVDLNEIRKAFEK